MGGSVSKRGQIEGHAYVAERELRVYRLTQKRGGKVYEYGGVLVQLPRELQGRVVKVIVVAP